MTRVLVVCSGNMCRSPLAAALLRERWGPDVSVASAGTLARPGSRAPRALRRALRSLGAPRLGATSNPLDPATVAEADVIIAIGEDHRAYLSLLPAVRQHTVVTLGELVRAARTGTPLAGTGVRERVASLPATVRAHHPPAERATLAAFPDPAHGDVEAYRATAQRIIDAVAYVCDWVLAGDRDGDAAGAMQDPAPPPLP